MPKPQPPPTESLVCSTDASFRASLFLFKHMPGAAEACNQPSLLIFHIDPVKGRLLAPVDFSGGRGQSLAYLCRTQIPHMDFDSHEFSRSHILSETKGSVRPA